MPGLEECVFCDRPSLEWRTITTEKFTTSFVSMPWFRTGHCLEIPNRHITTPAELEREEAAGIMNELGRLSLKLDKGFGTGIMQKYQPLQAENGIKVNHLHFHVFPRTNNEAGLFPVPVPNDFAGFFIPSEDEVRDLTAKLKP